MYQAAPRVQTMAVTAIVNFCDPDGCNASCLKPFLKELLEALFAALHSGSRSVVRSVKSLFC